jgi:FkbM family methyltransferase
VIMRGKEFILPRSTSGPIAAKQGLLRRMVSLDQNSLIYDVGAHNGDDSAYYLAKGCRVVAIDASPDACEMLRRRFASEVRSGRLVILNVGVSDCPGELEFQVNRSMPVLSTFQKQRYDEVAWVPDDWHPVHVPVMRLSDLIREHGAPYFVKIDVEFFDGRVLLDLLRKQIKPPFISAEAQEIDVYCLLVAMGYDQFRLVEGASVHEEFAEVSISTVGGLARSFRFVPECSGPCGDDLVLGWADKDETLRRLLQHGVGWIDVHARTDQAARGIVS